MNMILSTLLYICGIVLLIVLIILAIKAIALIDNANLLIDEINQRIRKIDGVLSVFEKIENGFINIKQSMFCSTLSNILKRIMKNKKRKEDDIYE